MLATAIVEIFPASIQLRGKSAAFLVLLGYLIIHFFEHTVTPHFHFGEEVHQEEFIQRHKGYSVLLGLLIHTFFDGIAIASGFIVSDWLGWVIFLGGFSAQDSLGIHGWVIHAVRWPEQTYRLGIVGDVGR